MGLWLRRLGHGVVVVLMLLGSAVAVIKWHPRPKDVYEVIDDLVGRKAPDIADNVERWLNGDELELGKLRGTTVLLFFWHPRDGGKSEAELPRIVALARRFAQKGLVTIAPCVCDLKDVGADVDPLISKYDIPFGIFRIAVDCDADVHQDPEEGYLIDRKGTPYCYVVDRRRKVAWGGPAAFLTARVIREVLAGK